MKKRWIPVVAICAAAVVAVTVGFPLLGNGIAKLLGGNSAAPDEELNGGEIYTTQDGWDGLLDNFFSKEEADPEAAGDAVEDGSPADGELRDDVALDGDTYAGEIGEGDDLRVPADSVKPETAPGLAPGVTPEEPADSAPAEPETSVPESTLQSGILTAGHWNDNENWAFWHKLQNGQQGYEKYLTNWDIILTRRVSVTTAPGATVKLLDEQNAVLWTAVADNQGRAWLFWRMKAGDTREPAKLTAEKGGKTASHSITADERKKNDVSVKLELMLDAVMAPKSLELALVLDTTGSMGDELAYLQAELQSVITEVKRQNANLPVRLSTNFYRDEGDVYEVEVHPFTEDITEAMSYLKAQTADGGGDYEEAVERALRKTIEGLAWSEDSTKILLLVLDAPPHNTAPIRAEMTALMEDAARQGIRVIPVASSGVDKTTEFLMRALSITTGGDYVFLTDDSGVGGGHIEPTIGDHEVKKLNTLLVELIGSYLK